MEAHTEITGHNSRCLLIPKLLKDHPQPERDNKVYLIWLSSGRIVTMDNDERCLLWPRGVVAWDGPIEPLPQWDLIEEAFQKYETTIEDNVGTEEAFTAGYLAGKEAK